MMAGASTARDYLFRASEHFRVGQFSQGIGCLRRIDRIPPVDIGGQCWTAHLYGAEGPKSHPRIAVIIREMAAAGIPLDTAPDIRGKTALSLSVFSNNTDAIHALAEANVDLSRPYGRQGRGCAIYQAILHGHKATLDALLAHGAKTPPGGDTWEEHCVRMGRQRDTLAPLVSVEGPTPPTRKQEIRRRQMRLSL